MKALKAYLRERFFPHLWCPGCGHGMVLNGLLQAIEKMGLSRNEIVMVSGIGCSSRITGYVDFHTLHTIHGRALAFATGVKMARPELNLIVPMGDGDALAIGGNHFIHAARRNIGLTSIIVNNHIYGMTGGQVSPVTPLGVLIYGLLIGFLTVIIRLFGGLSEGVMYAILLGNAASPLIDQFTQPRVFGRRASE